MSKLFLLSSYTSLSTLNILSLATEVAWKAPLPLTYLAKRGNEAWLSFHQIKGLRSVSIGLELLYLSISDSNLVRNVSELVPAGRGTSPLNFLFSSWALLSLPVEDSSGSDATGTVIVLSLHLSARKIESLGKERTISNSPCEMHLVDKSLSIPRNVLNYSLKDIFFKGIEVNIARVKKGETVEGILLFPASFESFFNI